MAAGQVELLGGYHAAGGSTGSSDNAGVKLKRSHTGGYYWFSRTVKGRERG